MLKAKKYITVSVIMNLSAVFKNARKSRTF